MRFNRLFPVLVVCAFAWSQASLAQAQAPPADTSVPLLRLDDAVSIALSNNRLVKISSLEAQK